MNKKNQYIVIFLLTVWSLLFISCSKGNDELSQATDNRILALSLTNNGTEYIGSIATATNEILITIPYETDLSTASVNYRISEGARILPNPKSVTNWNQEQVFNVISGSGEKRTYIIRIREDYEISKEDVTLSTDEDVKAFVKKGVQKIAGSLMIGNPSGPDSISNIDALTVLKDVNYKVVINPTYKGKDISGLRNVTNIGSLVINEPAHLENVTLKSLKNVSSGIIIHSKTIHQLNLPRLESISGVLELTMPSLSSLDFATLREAGDIKINCDQLVSFKATKLQEVKNNMDLRDPKNLSIFNVKSLRSIGGDFSLTGAAKIGMVILPQLASVTGKIEITGAGARDIHFPQLTATGSFRINNNSSLKNVSAPLLTTVTKDFSISNGSIRQLSGFALSMVGGSLTLSELSMLQSVDGVFKDLKKAMSIDIKNTLISGTLDFSKLEVTKVKVSSCSKITEIKLPEQLEEFSLSGTHNFKHPKWTKIIGLKKVENFSIDGIVLEERSNITIPDLETVTKSLRIRLGNVESLTFSELVKTNEVDINMTTSWYGDQGVISDVFPIEKIAAPHLISITNLSCNEPWLHTFDFPEVTSIDKLTIQCYYPFQKNTKITAITGMPKLSSISSVSFQNLTAFRDYSFLKTAVENGSLTKLSTRNCLYSPSLNDLKEGKFVQQ